MERWSQAMERALYGPGGFYVRNEVGPRGGFRTSVHASPLFARALARLIDQVDEALGRPDPLTVVDVGAGRGELLSALPKNTRWYLIAVERAPRPRYLDSDIEWRGEVPQEFEGVLLATEWLDNVPVDVVEMDDAGVVRYVLVNEAGEERLGDAVGGADGQWLTEWWPMAPGSRAEVGRARDEAWAAAVGRLRRGLALAVDYGHLRGDRPMLGSLTGYRGGWQVNPVPDGSCDITAHVAMDSVRARCGCRSTLVVQREALKALGADGGRPPMALASTDPAGYVRALAAASVVGELTDPAGLGGHLWLIHPKGIDPPTMAG